MDRLWWAYVTMPSTNRPAEFHEPSPDDAQRYERRARSRLAEAQESWITHVASPLKGREAGRHPKFTNLMGRAAARAITDDNAVHWLASEPKALADMRFLAEQVGTTAEEVLEVLPSTKPHRRLADHFWCDVVGTLAWLLDEIEGAIEKLRDRAIDWLVDELWERFRHSRETDWGGTPNGRRQPGPSRAERDHAENITDKLLKETIKSLLQKVCDGLWAKKITFDALILKLRLLAVWLCPDILAHRLIWEHCWAPLADEWVENYLLELMKGVFPSLDNGMPGDPN